MFLTIDDAKAELSEYFDPPQVEMFLPLLEPVVALVAASDAAPGTSQIGGRPKAGPDFNWPAVAADKLWSETLDAGTPEVNAANRAHLKAGIPMTFLASVDLQTASAIPQLAPLPDQGHLLFFYDFAIGPYENGDQVGRVIWDQGEGPRAEIAPSDALIAAADGMREETRALAAQYGGDEDWDGFGTIFEIAARPAVLVTGFDLPAPHAMPEDLSPDLARLFGGGEDLSDDELDTASLYEDAFYQSGEAAPVPLRLLSFAIPVQDDPLREVGVLNTFGHRVLADEQQAGVNDMIANEAQRWVLLAQVDVAAWLQQSAEGQIYIVIRKDDLAAGRFDRVNFVYQQS